MEPKFVINAAIAFVVIAGLYFGVKYHQQRKATFMAECGQEHSVFECRYRWDTLMARERAAIQSGGVD